MFHAFATGSFRSKALLLAVLAAGGAVAQPAGEGDHIHVGPPPRGNSGIRVTDDADGTSIRVSSVARASAAARAGLKPGDRVVTVGGCRVRPGAGLEEALASIAPGTSLELGVLRAAPGGGAPMLLRLHLPATHGPGAATGPRIPDAPCTP